ncbi:hypothetical protein DB756_02025, partial [Xanthomonas perforans]
LVNASGPAADCDRWKRGSGHTIVRRCQRRPPTAVRGAQETGRLQGVLAVHRCEWACTAPRGILVQSIGAST